MYNTEQPGDYAWYHKMLFRLFPVASLKFVAWKMGCSFSFIRHGHIFFEGASVDIVPTKTGGRGFRIILNNKLSLYFYQDGKHFKYDGWELGEYEDGDITVFDSQRIKAACENIGD
jgi:hypothetical protein